ncbi:MAG: hypothetical protein LUH02_01235 [Erysipelotrichaceae bacterium]|nr:hypothetical protein [Erysipelotrichaceae bacterium]
MAKKNQMKNITPYLNSIENELCKHEDEMFYSCNDELQKMQVASLMLIGDELIKLNKQIHDDNVGVIIERLDIDLENKIDSVVESLNDVSKKIDDVASAIGSV